MSTAAESKDRTQNYPLHYFGYPPTRQIGPLIFFSGLCGLNSRGIAVRSYAKNGDGLPFPALGMAAPDSWEAPLIAQATIIYDGMKQMLPRGGVDEEGILFYGIYVKDIRDYPTLVRVRSAKFAGGISPPCTCSQVAELPCSGAVVYFDAIGFSPDRIEGPIERLIIDSSQPGNKMANYQLGTRVGPYVFLAGVVAPDVASAPFYFSEDRTESASDEEYRHGLACYALERSACNQARAICSTLGSLLKEQGGTLQNLGKINMYLTDMRDLPAVSRVLEKEFGTMMPAMTVIEVGSLARADFTVEIEGIAYIGDSIADSRIDFSSTISIGRNPPACRCGDLIFVSGTVGFDRSLGRLPVDLSDASEIGAQVIEQLLTGEERRRPAAVAVAVQTWQILNQIEEGLGESRGLERFVKLTIYLKDLHNISIVTKILERRIEIKSRPALTIFQPTALPLPDAEVMIEAIAAA